MTVIVVAIPALPQDGHHRIWSRIFRLQGCGGLAAKAELLTGIEAASSQLARKIVLIGGRAGLAESENAGSSRPG